MELGVVSESKRVVKALALGSAVIFGAATFAAISESTHPETAALAKIVEPAIEVVPTTLPETTTVPVTTTTEAPTTTVKPTPTTQPKKVHVSTFELKFPDSNLAEGAYGEDVSWPNCNRLPTISRAITWFAIVGINHGHPFSLNDCLAAEVNIYGPKLHGLYLNTSWPGRTEPAVLQYQDSPQHCEETDGVCWAYNWGFQAGKYSVAEAAELNLNSAEYWLDVETRNQWSPDNPLANRSSLVGTIDAINKFAPTTSSTKPTVGFYSSSGNSGAIGMWQRIVGDWQPLDEAGSKYPNWVASAGTNEQTVMNYCVGKDFSGGGTRYVQTVVGGILDVNRACPVK